VSVRGFKRVPSPAAKIIACLIKLAILFFRGAKLRIIAELLLYLHSVFEINNKYEDKRPENNFGSSMLHGDDGIVPVTTTNQP
jgi:hypothetical protein